MAAAEAGPKTLPGRCSTETGYVGPGDGVAPVVRILQKLADKQYAGALSVELFRAEFVSGEPSQVAAEIRRKCEAVMRQAQVL